jgi:hypothetical protein
MNRPTIETIREAGQWLMRELWDHIPCENPNDYTSVIATFVSTGITLCAKETGHELVGLVRAHAQGWYQGAFEKPTHTAVDRVILEQTLSKGLMMALGYYRGYSPTAALHAGHYLALSNAIWCVELQPQRPDRLYEIGDNFIRPKFQFCYN